MAAKIRCPKCDTLLKEEGDEGKYAMAEYRVYDSLWNSKHEEKKFRVIKCLMCNDYFDPFDEINRKDL